MIAAVIPSRNGARWLDDALGSVRAQGELITEIVVVDDGSTDATTDVLAHHPDVISVRNEVPCGPAAARNIGVAATTAPLVTFLDVDDVWTPNALEQRLALLQEGPYDVVATRAFFRSMGKPVGTVPDTGSGFWGFSLGTRAAHSGSLAPCGPARGVAPSGRGHRVVDTSEGVGRADGTV